MASADQGMQGQMLDTFGALAPLLAQLDHSLKLPPNPRAPKTRKRGDHPMSPKAEDDQHMDEHKVPHTLQLLKTLTQLVVRHDQELQSLRRMDQFILF